MTKRKCRGCTLCCTVLGVPSIQKDAWTDCEHRTDHGCSIFANAPDECREWECAWRLGAFRVKDRPDRVGLFVHGAQYEDEAIGKHFQVHVVRDGVEQYGRGKRIVDLLLSQGPVALIRSGGRRQMLYVKGRDDRR